MFSPTGQIGWWVKTVIFRPRAQLYWALRGHWLSKIVLKLITKEQWMHRCQVLSRWHHMAKSLSFCLFWDLFTAKRLYVDNYNVLRSSIQWVTPWWVHPRSDSWPQLVKLKRCRQIKLMKQEYLVKLFIKLAELGDFLHDLFPHKEGRV